MDKVLEGLIPGTAGRPGPTYAVQVRAVGSNTISDWSPQFTFFITADTTPPTKIPSTPSVAGRLGNFDVTWNGLDKDGLAMDADFARVEIHAKADDSSAWTPDSSTYKGYLTFGASYPVPNLAYGPTWYARLVPVDTSGNKGTPSATSAGAIIQGAGTPTIGPGAIDNTMIGNLQIWTKHLEANAVKAGKIDAGIITAREISSGAITTDKIDAGAVHTDRLSIGTISTNRCVNPMFEEFNSNQSNGMLPPDGTYYQNTSVHNNGWTLSLITGTSDRAETQVGLSPQAYIGAPHSGPAPALNGRCKVMMPCTSLTKGSTIKTDQMAVNVNETIYIGGDFYTNGFTVAAATTTSLPAYTYGAGTATLTANSPYSELTIDGVTFRDDNIDSILVKDEGTTARNGIYTVVNKGSSTTPWVLTRHGDWSLAYDFQQSANLRPVYVASGTNNNTEPLNDGVNAGTYLEYYCQSVSSVDGSPIIWVTKEVPKVKVVIENFVNGTLSTTNNVKLNAGAVDEYGVYVFGKYTVDDPLSIKIEHVVPANGTTIATTYTVYGTSSLTEVYADGMKAMARGKATSELTAAGLRLFNTEGNTMVSITSGKDSFIASDSTGMNVARISNDGTVSGKVGDFGSIKLAGKDLATELLVPVPLGIVARSTFSTGISPTTDLAGGWTQPVINLSADIKAGRSYRITASPVYIVGPSVTPTVNYGGIPYGGLRIWYTTDGQPAGPGTGGLIATGNTENIPLGGAGGSMLKQVGVEGVYHATLDATMHLALHVWSAPYYPVYVKTSGSPAYYCQFVVEDIGASPVEYGGGSNLRKFVTTWPAAWSGSYAQNNARIAASGYYCNQGYWDNTYDRRASMIGFTGAATAGEIGLTMNQALVGATLFERVELYMHNYSWLGSKSGTAYISTHNATSGQPGTYAKGNVTGFQYVRNWAANTGKWIILDPGAMPPAYWSLTNSASYLSKGIVLHVNSNDSQYAGSFYGVNAGGLKPQIRLTYYKP